MAAVGVGVHADDVDVGAAAALGCLRSRHAMVVAHGGADDVDVGVDYAVASDDRAAYRAVPDAADRGAVVVAADGRMGGRWAAASAEKIWMKQKVRHLSNGAVCYSFVHSLNIVLLHIVLN